MPKPKHRSRTVGGPKTRRVLHLLERFESRNVTLVEGDGSWPIVWERARGCSIWDIDGRRYLDLTAAFGVAATGHANKRVVAAGQKQLARLPHAMGDVHPHARKAELAERLSELTFRRWTKSSGKTLFCNSGFEAVEAALKTVLLATGKPKVIAFSGAYHGLGYGALNATERGHFREPFRKQLVQFASFLPFPATEKEVKELRPLLNSVLEKRDVGAILVEPIQGRGGIRVPPASFLNLLRKFCDEHQLLLVLDEVLTGFGRTGAWFACEHSGVVPDLLCVGKALTGGFPLSACIGSASLMDAAWPRSSGEAIHTSTFLGNPVGCAMALAQLAEIEKRQLPARARVLGEMLLSKLQDLAASRLELSVSARGKGLLAALEVRDLDGRPATAKVIGLMKWLLKEGFIFLPEGEHSNVLSFAPPLIIAERDLNRAVAAVGRGFEAIS